MPSATAPIGSRSGTHSGPSCRNGSPSFLRGRPMRPDDADLPPEEQAAPCVRCGAKGDCEVWEHWVCYPCVSDWQDRAPTGGEIEARHGKDADTCAAYRKFTVGWVKAH